MSQSQPPNLMAQLVDEGLAGLSPHLREWAEAHLAHPPRLERFSDALGEETDLWLVTDHTGDRDSSYRVVFDPKTRRFGLVMGTAQGAEFLGTYGAGFADAILAM